MSAPNRESIMKMAKDLVTVKPDAVNPFANENSWQYKAWAAGAAVAQQGNKVYQAIQFKCASTSTGALIRKINETKEFDGAIYKVAEVRSDVLKTFANVTNARTIVPTPVAEHIRRLMADANTCADPMRAGRLKRKAFVLTARHATI